MSRTAGIQHDSYQQLIGETLRIVAITAGLLVVAVTALIYLGGIGLGFAVAAPAGFCVIAALVLMALPAHPYARFGAANILTTIRAGLTALLGGLLFEANRLGAPDIGLAWFATGAAALALMLDAVDGRVARATNQTSAFGARFDMEIDALLMLVLCMLLWASDKVDGWLLAIGLMRYGFGAARILWPRLAGELADSRRRQLICALQGITLCAALAPVVSPFLATMLTLVALLGLIYSFGVDTLDLARSKRPLLARADHS